MVSSPQLTQAPANRSPAPNRKRLTNTELDRLLRAKPDRQYVVWDDKETGLQVLVSPGPKHKKQATVTWRVCYYLRDKPGVPKYLKLGRFPDETITYNEEPYSCSDVDKMRNVARAMRNAAEKGEDPRRPSHGSTGNFKAMVKRYLARPQQEPQRTLDEVERIFERYVLPEWSNRDVESIEKNDVADLLTKIADGKIKGPDGQLFGTFTVARTVRVQLSAFYNWYVEAHGSAKFRSPIVKSKNWKQPQGRERVLEADDIRALWRAAGDLGVYGAVVRTALLTMQRFHKVSTMLRDDLKDRVKVPARKIDGEWKQEFEVEDVWDPTREDDPFNKGVSLVPLSPLAREVIDTVPKVDGKNSEDFVFTLTGKGPLQGWSKMKKALDKAMLTELKAQAKKQGRDPNKVQLKPWQHRDLRRTARTLMARSEVPSDIAELCMGHVKKSVERTYDKHDYLDRKQAAFKRLADHVQMIVRGPASANVTVLKPRR